MSCRIASAPRKRLLFVLFAVSMLSTPALADVVPGYDLFATQPAASLYVTLPGGPQVVPFIGVPIPGLGNTDTIIQRTSDITTLPGTSPLQMIELSLESVAPVNVGGSFFDVFVTLDATDLAPPPPTPQSIVTLTPSTGTLVVSPGGGGGYNISSFFDIFVDVELAPIGGGSPTDLGQQYFQLSGNGLGTSIQPPLYPIDPNLPAGGFFLDGPLLLLGTGGLLPLADAQTPEPSALVPLLGALAAMVLRRRRR